MNIIKLILGVLGGSFIGSMIGISICFLIVDRSFFRMMGKFVLIILGLGIVMPICSFLIKT